MTSVGQSGTIASFGRRVAAFLIDTVSSAAVATLFTAPELPRNRSLLVFAVVYFACTLLAQQTLGMKLLGLRVVRVDQPAPVGAARAAARTVGVMLLIPTVLRNAEGRSLHDVLTQTAVIRAV